ncbi:MAG TPA: response regulator [Deltaproteobacteria bacterium]|nr:response regulator [Deltaproteobacteria bacterium]
MKSKGIVLIVEDNESTQLLIEGAMEDEKFETIVAGDGTAGWTLAHQHHPDVAILDVMMPGGIDGFELCRRIKQDRHLNDTRVIMLTARAFADDRVQGLKESGADDYLTKPFEMDELVSRVTNLWHRKKEKQGLEETITRAEHDKEILAHKAELGIQAGGLAHDINNILAAAQIIEVIPDLMAQQEHEQIMEYLGLALEAVKLGREMTKGYTSYLRDIGEEPSPQFPQNLLAPIDMYSRSFKGKLIKDYEDNLPMVVCKGHQIKRVVVNLFTNARQALEETTDPVIKVKLWSSGDRVIFSISDNGSGIPADIINRIFEERFTTKKTGTGLGLHMVKQILESYGGTVKVESVVNIGTTFTVSLPAQIS